MTTMSTLLVVPLLTAQESKIALVETYPQRLYCCISKAGANLLGEGWVASHPLLGGAKSNNNNIIVNIIPEIR